MIKKVNKINRMLFYLDTSKSANCNKLPNEIRDILMEINQFLYDINFDALDFYWRKHVLYKRKDRTAPIVEHFKNSPEWLQLQKIEKNLAVEYENLKHDKEKHPCYGCEHLKPGWDGFYNRLIIDDKGCDETLHNGKCPNVIKMKKLM